MFKFWTSFNNTPWQTTVAKDVGPLLVDTNGRLGAYIGTKTDIKLPDVVKNWRNGICRQATETITVKSNEDKVLVWTSDKEIVFEDAQPFIDKNEHTQIPIRAVAETLNCKVDWDGENHIVTITKDSDTVKIVIDSNIMTINGREITMDTTAEVINGRTYIPIRFVGEVLGAKVEWGM